MKGQRSLGLIYSHCPIGLNISSDYNDFGFNSFKKSTFVDLGSSFEQTW